MRSRGIVASLLLLSVALNAAPYSYLLFDELSAPLPLPPISAERDSVGIGFAYSLPVSYRSEGESLQKLRVEQSSLSLGGVLRFDRGALAFVAEGVDFSLLLSEEKHNGNRTEIERSFASLAVAGEREFSEVWSGTLTLGGSEGGGDQISLFPVVAAELRAVSGGWKSELRVEQLPVLTGVPLFRRGSNDAERTFPIALLRRSLEYRLSYEEETKRIELRQSYSRLLSSDRVESENAMPIEVSGEIAELSLRAFSGPLFLQLGGRLGDVDLDLYDDSRRLNRYGIFHNIRYSSLAGEMGGVLSGNRLALFGEALQLTMPGRASLDLYPFSVWSFLDPKVYRFSDGLFRFHNLGLSAGRELLQSRIGTSSANLRGSYAAWSGSIMRAERRVVVLIPTYGPADTLSLDASRALLFDLELSHRISFGQTQLEFSARQLFPLLLRSDKSAKQSDKGSALYGGFRAGVALSKLF